MAFVMRSPFDDGLVVVVYLAQFYCYAAGVERERASSIAL